MLNKIVSIVGVGKFEDFRPSNGGIEFTRVTLIYSSNGRGKTTTSSIFNSVSKSLPSLILGRKAINCAHEPLVEIEVGGSAVIFTQGQWNASTPCIEVFDSAFVENNICSGAQVLHAHKKNLYSFIVGRKGVSLTRKIASLDDQVRELNQKIAEQERQIVAKIVQGLPLEKFLALPIITDVDNQIVAKATEVEALKKVKEIKEKTAFSKIQLPNVPYDEFSTILQKTIEDVSDDAERATKTHIQTCMDEHGESWLGQGLEYIGESNTCPFCARPLDGITLVESFRSYFSEAYGKLKEEISEEKRKINGTLSADAYDQLLRTTMDNERLNEFWSPLIRDALPDFDMDAIKHAWDNLRTSLEGHLDRKTQSPLERIQFNQELMDAKAVFVSHAERVIQYSDAIERLNGLITVKKSEVAVGDLASAQHELNILHNTKLRHSSPADGMCDALTTTYASKERVVEVKDQTKDELEAYTENFLREYGDGLNRYLEKFGVDYRLGVPKKSYTGGKASVSYCLKINGSEIGVDLPESDEEPHFGNTLSSGDKTTLAFAFFLARLEHENLESKVVVFDDPISSLDRFRKHQTHLSILDVAKRARQVIVLSHDMHFLRTLAEGCKAELKDMDSHWQIRAAGTKSVIEPWDAITDSLAQEHRELKRMSDYLRNGAATDDDRREVAKCIRSLVEVHLKMTFPESLLNRKMLGNCIDAIEQSRTGQDIHKLHPYLDALRSINTYSQKYHHSENPNAETEPIEHAELVVHIKKGFEFLAQLYEAIRT